MVKNNEGIYQFSSFLQFPNLIHGFSTRSFGNMGRESMRDSISNFSLALSIPQNTIIFMEQVHGGRVVEIKSHQKENFLPATDALLTQEKRLFLSVRTADCVPLMLYDPVMNTCGVVHIGWKGAQLQIVAGVIEKMKNVGSKVVDIRVGIGPSIRVCCYAIDRKRARLFADTFPQFAAIILEERGNTMYLNLQELVRRQLVENAILLSNIEDSAICTKDSVDEFFSYREEGPKKGVFAGIIGML